MSEPYRHEPFGIDRQPDGPLFRDLGERSTAEISSISSPTAVYVYVLVRGAKLDRRPMTGVAARVDSRMRLSADGLTMTVSTSHLVPPGRRFVGVLFGILLDSASCRVKEVTGCRARLPFMSSWEKDMFSIDVRG